MSGFEKNIENNEEIQKEKIIKLEKRKIELERSEFDIKGTGNKSRLVNRTKLANRLKEIRTWNIISYGIIVLSIIFMSIWIIQSSAYPYENILLIFTNVFFYLGIICVITGVILLLNTWKIKLEISEKLLLETILYRAYTNITELAKAKQMSVKEVRSLVSLFIEQKKINGEINGDTIVIKSVRTPNCGICDRPIYEVAINMLICPYCKRPYHKDHLLEYFHRFEKKCPECAHSLDLKDIYKAR